MSRKGENIYKRKDGRWEARYIKCYKNNKAVYGYLYDKSYKAVKEKQRKAVCIPESIQDTSISRKFSHISEEWLENKKNNVKESTYSKYKYILLKHMLPVIGNYDINIFNTNFVSSFVSEKLINGKLDKSGGLAEKTVKDITGILKSILLYAKNNSYSIDFAPELIKISNVRHEMKILSKREQSVLEGHLIQNIDLNKLSILLSLYTGIRIGELCALKWENICLTDCTITIKHTMQRIQVYNEEEKTKIHISTPKSYTSIRSIPLQSFLVKYLRKFKPDSDEAFFTTGAKNKYIEPRTFQNRFKALLKEIKINDINFHVLRHTFATRCIETGFDIKTLSEILGHSSTSITLNCYVHTSIEQKRLNMEKLKLI